MTIAAKRGYSMTSRKFNLQLAALALCLVVSLAGKTGPAAAQAQPGDVVAVVNGVELTEQTLALAASAFGPQLQQIPEAQRRKALINVIVDMTLLAEAAKLENLDQTDDFKARLNFLKTRTLHDEYLAQKIGGSVTDADIQAEYDANIGNLETPTETRARHILVKTKEEGDAIIADLDNGGDFVELAKTKSTGPSGPTGGDLGYFTRERMVKPFADAAFTMEPGSHSKAPVQSQFGWHVIKVEDRRQKPKPTLEQMSNQIRDGLVRERFTKEIADLKSRAVIDIKNAADK